MDVPAIASVRRDESESNESPTFLDALDLYLRLKGQGKDKVFFRTATRNIEYVTKVLGNKSIKSYSSSDGAKFRDWLIEQGMGINTVKRVFSSVRSIVNIIISEEGLDCSNGFAGTYFPDSERINERKPIPVEIIKSVQHICKNQDDDLRWLVALLSDSGMRLGEAVGLLKSDIKLDAEIPHLSLKPHQWRTLKTKGSQRSIPLVGASLWACKRIMESNNDTQFAFPRYTNTSNCNANSASASLNKWLKDQLTDDYVIHSFRHSLRDRLRAVECPSDIVDSIGGWITAGVGQGYGRGYSLPILHKWMLKIL
jgi:integrase